MATCNYIPAKKQNQSAMRAVIRYVSQDAKTLDENGYRYLTGINCLGQAAYEEFMATKNLYGKRSGAASRAFLVASAIMAGLMLLSPRNS